MPASALSIPLPAPAPEGAIVSKMTLRILVDRSRPKATADMWPSQRYSHHGSRDSIVDGWRDSTLTYLPLRNKTEST